MEEENIYNDISYENIINIINKNKYPEEIIVELEKKEIPSKEKIFSYILDFDKNISFIGFLMLRSQFDKIYKRPYLTEFFTSKKESLKYDDEDKSTWVEEFIDYKEDKIYKKLKVELNKDEVIELIYIIEKIYNLLINDLSEETKKTNGFETLNNLIIKKVEEEGLDGDIIEDRIEDIDDEIFENEKEEEKEDKNEDEKEEEKIEKEEKEGKDEKDEKEEEKEEKNGEEKGEENEEREEEKEDKDEYYNIQEMNLENLLIEIIINIYDLEEKLINLFLNDNWFKLLDNLYKTFDKTDDLHEKILTLIYFLLSYDKTYITYMKFIKNYPDIMFNYFKRIYQSLGGCCCDCYKYKTIYGYIMENFDLLIKVIRHAESSQNIDKNLFKIVHEFKMDITQHFIDEIGKNSYILFFRRFAAHLKIDDIFALFCKTQNLEKNLIEKDNVYSHMIDELDNLIYVCNSPSIFIDALVNLLELKNANDILKNKQIFNTMLKCIFITEDYDVKEKLFKNIIKKQLEMITDPNFMNNMPKLSVIFQPLLDKDDPEILKIFYNNNFFDVGTIIPNAIQKYINKNYTGYNLEYLVDILNSLVLIGEKIKEQSYSKSINPLIQELKKNNSIKILSQASHFTYYILDLLK